MSRGCGFPASRVASAKVATPTTPKLDGESTRAATIEPTIAPIELSTSPAVTHIDPRAKRLVLLSFDELMLGAQAPRSCLPFGPELGFRGEALAVFEDSAFHEGVI